MKKFGIITTILLSIMVLNACSPKNEGEKVADSITSSSKKKTVPSDYIKISEPYFKPKEQVKEEYESLGLKVKFVVTNFDDKADSNQRKLIKGMCDQLSDQSNVMYFYDEDDIYNPDNGYHAKKGSVIYVGYTDHDYNPKPANEVFGTDSVDSSSTAEKTSKSVGKNTGSIIDLKGTANEEDVHIVTADEEGTYAVECYDVPYPDDFATFQDYSDLKCYTTIFPDGKKYDMAMDSDKSIYDQQLTSPLYIKDLHDNGYEEITYTGPDVALKKGYQIMVLNGSVKFTKK